MLCWKAFLVLHSVVDTKSEMHSASCILSHFNPPGKLLHEVSAIVKKGFDNLSSLVLFGIRSYIYICGHKEIRR